MRIGILGGTFDPIHEGHLHVARGVSEVFSLDQVWFMVASLPPHKRKEAITGAFHRFAMTALAVQESPKFIASDWELNRPGPSFTVDTLDELSQRYPPDQFCFLAGSDSLRELHLWKDYGRLLHRHCLIFVQRPGAEVDPERLREASWPKQVIKPVSKAEQATIEAGRSFLVTLAPPPPAQPPSGE